MPFLRTLSRWCRPAEWVGRLGFFRRAANLWNCLALHLVVDHGSKTMRLTFGIPGIITFVGQCPILPDWLGGQWLAGVGGERAEYGFWHDYFETKLQWRKEIDRPGLGYEKRWVHSHPEQVTVQRETLLSDHVLPQGNAWAAEQHFERWRLILTTWRAASHKAFVPALYDHYFTLSGYEASGASHDQTLRSSLSPQLCLDTVFDQLVKKFEA